MKLLKLALLVIAIMAVTLGSTFYFLKSSGILTGGQQADAAPVVEAAPLAKPIFQPLDPFTVTLRDNNTTRILYVEITLRVENETSREQLVEYMPEVRNRVISELTKKTPGYLQTNEGRNELAANLVKSLSEPYYPNPTRPGISNVLFTAFVIQ
ncbi:MAG: flagellar basal body-associated FliL family protein [Pusillimonas sp.]